MVSATKPLFKLLMMKEIQSLNNSSTSVEFNKLVPHGSTCFFFFLNAFFSQENNKKHGIFPGGAAGGTGAGVVMGGGLGSETMNFGEDLNPTQLVRVGGWSTPKNPPV
jgi:hypothetical protein